MHLCAIRDQPTAFFVMEHSRSLSETLPQEDHIRRQSFVIDRILLDCVLLQMFLIAGPFCLNLLILTSAPSHFDTLRQIPCQPAGRVYSDPFSCQERSHSS